MAATDQTYRSQHGLDIVFAVSSLAMLLSIVWMFVDDYNRPYKVEQRDFRAVETALAQRQAVAQIPARADFEREKAAFEAARKDYESEANQGKLRELKYELAQLRPLRERAEAKYQTIKADLESANSFYNIAQEQNDSDGVDKYGKRIRTLGEQLMAQQAERDGILGQVKDKQTRIDQIEQPMTKAQSAWKKTTDKFDTQVKLAYTKQWGWADWFRALPILDAFASPVKIHQITNNDIPIDYNFKQVTRFDRCMTCHLGIDRPAYTRDNLRALTKVTPEQEKKVGEARALLEERLAAYQGLPEASKLPRADQLRLSTVPESTLTEARVSEYAAHPRLDLFVGANSKHPAEKFGCTACHSGQGSATDFTLAAHTPNDPRARKDWEEHHGWEHQHMWDFPMLPQRFVESSCIKCHYEVTDLIGSDNRVEAPKLIRGYNLIKENGCFGCHEIAGTKGGRRIGPDLRLEPTPPLSELSPAEQVKAMSDAENPPGTLRKVGPSLFRVSEKTNYDWVVKWIRSPRGFRPDTKMPHFYGLSNNDPHDLPDEQKKFPDAEIRSIAYYLMQASGKFVQAIGKQAEEDAKNPGARAADEQRQAELIAKGKEKLDEKEKAELAAIRQRYGYRHNTPLKDQAPGHEGDPIKGRRLFSERGCLACHSHDGTHEPVGTKGTDGYVPDVHSTAQFGPDLSQVAVKLGKTPGDKKSARVYLIQWIMDPHVFSPRSRMPVTHLTAEEAADVAAWLLSQPPRNLGEEWEKLTVAEPDAGTLQDLARVYFVRLLPKSDIDALLVHAELGKEIIGELPQDERDFAESYQRGPDRLGSLKYYLGKKAVGRLGCYACHGIPGFENAKPIGTGLNDWGKKDPARLAFDNIDNFVERHYFPVPTWAAEGGKLPAPKLATEDGHEVKKMPYEEFYWSELMHRQRIGFLNQKLVEPRSYDYGMQRAWDDRYRMPQFKFSRIHRRAGEADADFEARAHKEEADAREAVMTFILGLTAEQVPQKMVNQPSGDRLHEVKGRQVLDTFNCAGCHLLRPGAYDIRVNEGSLKELEAAYRNGVNQTQSSGMYTFPLHHFWSGKNPASPDRVVAPGVYPRLVREDEDDPDSPYTVLQLVLAEAMRFVGNDPGGNGKTALDIPTSISVFVPLKDLGVDPKAIKSMDDLERALGGEGPLGGRFADILVPYLNKKDPDLYKLNPNTKNSGQARASLPPPLIGEGERVQPQWLYQFLLDPSAVRRMSILRMPKFNLSHQDAQALVDYFAGVEKITNPGMYLNYPGAVIPQQGPLDDAFWKDRTKAYLKRLKDAGPQGGPTGYQQRLTGYEAAWKAAAKQAGAALDAEIERARKQKDENAKQLEALQEKLKKADGKDKAGLEKQAEDAKAMGTAVGDALKKLEEKRKGLTPEALEKSWKENEAYAADAYHMIVNRQMCLQCHEVGGYPPSNPQTQGPPLALVHERLRPGWLYRWIATPQRHLPYESLMPVNFPRLKQGEKASYQDVLAGTPPEQVEAIRDALMNYPRIFALPVNQQWNPNLQSKPAGDKK